MSNVLKVGLSVVLCIGLSACATTTKNPDGGQPLKIIITPISGSFSELKCKVTLGKVVEFKGKKYCARKAK